MTLVEKWALDKSPLLRLLTPSFATYVCSYDDDFKELRERRFSGKQYQVDRLSLWFKQYHSFQGASRRLFKLFWDEILQIPEIKGDQGRAASLLYHLSQKAYDSDINETPVPLEVSTIVKETVAEGGMEFQFLIFVMIPCLLVYRQYPLTLIKRARSGNELALKQLLSLDPYMLHNPRIGKVVQSFRFNHKKSKFNGLIEASLIQPSLKISRKKWLKSCAGLFSLLSEISGKKLTEPQIRDFFNAVAFDTKRQRKDPDLPELHETFRRQILHERNIWRKGLYPDKKNVK